MQGSFLLEPQSWVSEIMEALMLDCWCWSSKLWLARLWRLQVPWGLVWWLQRN